MNLQMMNPKSQFVISTSTFVLQTIRKENSLKTQIIEGDHTFIHPRKSMHLIRAACQHYGTSLKVATSHARRILNNRHKVPILVAFDRGIPLIMIPTMSSTSEQNIWISFHSIVNYKADELGNTIIYLMNNHSITVNVSESTIQRQVSLAHILQLDYQNKFNHFDGGWFTPRYPHRP